MHNTEKDKSYSRQLIKLAMVKLKVDSISALAALCMLPRSTLSNIAIGQTKELSFSHALIIMRKAKLKLNDLE